MFEDSFHQLRSRTPEEMRHKLSVQFQGEEGIDAGGVSREWYQIMGREIFNPNLALFIAVPEGGTTFQPNPSSVVQSDRGTNHLDYFRWAQGGDGGDRGASGTKRREGWGRAACGCRGGCSSVSPVLGAEAGARILREPRAVV